MLNKLPIGSIFPLRVFCFLGHLSESYLGEELLTVFSNQTTCCSAASKDSLCLHLIDFVCMLNDYYQHCNRCAKSLPLCPTLCDPMNCSLPPHCSLHSAHGILQAKRVGCQALLQGFFLTQGSNLCLLRLLKLAGKFFTTSTTWEALSQSGLYYNVCTSVSSYNLDVVVQSLSHAILFAAPWMVAHQAPLSMGFPRQRYQSGLPFPSPGYLSNPEIKPLPPELTNVFFIDEPSTLQQAPGMQREE